MQTLSLLLPRPCKQEVALMSLMPTPLMDSQGPCTTAPRKVLIDHLRLGMKRGQVHGELIRTRTRTERSE